MLQKPASQGYLVWCWSGCRLANRCLDQSAPAWYSKVAAAAALAQLLTLTSVGTLALGQRHLHLSAPAATKPPCRWRGGQDLGASRTLGICQQATCHGIVVIDLRQ